MKWIASILLTLAVLGMAFAVAPASDWTAGTPGKYVPSVTANVTTEGGNVTPLNLTSNVSTEKWAGFWGDVAGNLVLSDGTSSFFTWVWDPANGGEVCAIEAASGFDWSGVTTPTASDIDTIWGLVGTDTDSAANTLLASCNVDVAGSSVNGLGNDTAGGFTTCAISDGDDTLKEDYAFCTDISDGATLFNGLTGDYELMVPTDDALAATETVYFWLELD